MKQLPDDFSDFLNTLDESEVRYLVVAFLSYDDLVRNKHASGRLKDLADLESLGES